MPTLHTLLTALLLIAVPATTLAQSMSSSESSSQSSSSQSSLSSSRSSDAMVDVEDIDFRDIDLSRYNDAPWDRMTDTAVSVLTRLQVLEGNPDPSDPSGDVALFASDRPLNRAEFMQIVMRILPDTSGATINLNCFPDVRADIWYAQPVCRAKRLGIVRGNVREGMPASEWRFEPVRSVQYEEAITVLTKLFALPVNETSGSDWYVPYLQYAQSQDLAIAGLRPGDSIMRGEMARLTAAYLAFSAGRLGDYRDAENVAASSISSSRSSLSSASSISSSSSFSSSSSVVSGVSQVRSDIVLLGEMSPPLAGVQFFSSLEPVNTTALVVTLAEESPSISSILVYREDGTLLGTASRTTDARTYRLAVSDNAFPIPQREERRLYVQARVAADNAGGRSGDTVQVQTIRLEGTGDWSDETYAIDSTAVFPVFQTALARITSVTNAGPTESVLGPGDDQVIGAFTFTGEETVATADLRVTSLAFDINASSHFTITDAELGIPGSSERSSCTVSSQRIECGSIPTSIGRISGSQTIRVYADVEIGTVTGDRRLRLTLDEPGFPNQAGDVTWTDGVTTFTWLGLERPLAEGTLWR